ncbi:MAG TPA: DUF504 domain-containing protein [Methylococcaceae bacterium]|jgi:uncharacterized protein (UPF0248 family)|nr:DUF504 domain-containing protein [Methylococcaceae bacterium]
MPIQDLLNKIRWDAEFGRGDFKIGYYDRIEDRIIVVSMKEIVFPKNSHGIFELIDGEGQVHSIPLHRVKAVYKNGDLIWFREH